MVREFAEIIIFGTNLLFAFFAGSGQLLADLEPSYFKI